MPKISTIWFLGALVAVSCTGISNEKAIVLDPIRENREWQNVVAQGAIRKSGLSVWVPTNDLQTSSLVRVPRFVSTYGDYAPQSRFDRERFAIHPRETGEVFQLEAVRNETVSAQVALIADQEITSLRVMTSQFSGDQGMLPDPQIRFVKYIPVESARSAFVFTGNIYNIAGGEVSGFGAPNIIADPLVEIEEIRLPSYRAQPIWLTFEIPDDVAEGVYTGTIQIYAREFEVFELGVNILVKQPILPDPENYDFQLELWLNPGAIAVAHQEVLWSERHWALISLYYRDLASRGAKTITAPIVPTPWAVPWLNGGRHPQTGIGYPSTIRWIRNRNGNWEFDFSLFDRLVEVASEAGVHDRIDTFSLVPFDREVGRILTYWDEECGCENVEIHSTESEFYKSAWSSFLVEFRNHLVANNLLEKTYLSFDESSKDEIDEIISLVKNSAPEFIDQFNVAGKVETSDYARSLSIAFQHFHKEEVDNEELLVNIAQRSFSGKTTTFYLYGEPNHPNSFAFSPAIESRLIPWLAHRYKTDGYLRWAYNSWPNKNPYDRPVFNFIQGDDYLVYPGNDAPISSVRWELFRDGVEDYELLALLELSGADEALMNEAIKVATRNFDGRKKSITDFADARNLLLEDIGFPISPTPVD